MPVGRWKQTVQERFLCKVEIDPLTSCWAWKAYVTPDGYGLFYFRGQMRPAHRCAYELFVGAIPEGFEVDHLCKNTRCVNPDPKHLEAVPARINFLRSNVPAAVNLRKTHCLRGHALVPENLCPDKLGKRKCKQCRESRYERKRLAA